MRCRVSLAVATPLAARPMLGRPEGPWRQVTLGWTTPYAYLIWTYLSEGPCGGRLAAHRGQWRRRRAPAPDSGSMARGGRRQRRRSSDETADPTPDEGANGGFDETASPTNTEKVGAPGEVPTLAPPATRNLATARSAAAIPAVMSEAFRGTAEWAEVVAPGRPVTLSPSAVATAAALPPPAAG